MPFVILGAIIAGILEELLPQQLLTKMLPKSVLPAVMIGGMLGLLFPMCECGIVVVMRRLLRKGLPLSSCIAYMLAGPIINAVVIFSTWVAFRDHQIGPEMVGLRVGLAFVVATVTGFVVHLQQQKYGTLLLLKAGAVPPPLPSPPTAAQSRGQGGDSQQSAQETPPYGPAPAPRRSFGQRLGNIS